MNRADKVLDMPSTVIGHVFWGQKDKMYFFNGSPENIASFIMRNEDAKSIIITRIPERLVIHTKGSHIANCGNTDELSAICAHLVPMQKGEASPVVFPLYAVDEMSGGEITPAEATLIYRHGKNDFTSWDVNLPSCTMEQFKTGERIAAADAETLLKKMPVNDAAGGNQFSLFVRENGEFALYTAPVGYDFIVDFSHEGCSVRSDLASTANELEDTVTEINIMWDDLKPEAQKRIMRMLGDNGNYDVVPITTIYAPEQEQGVQMN